MNPNSLEWATRVKGILNCETDPVSDPVRLEDFDVTTSFAHLTPNLTIDEVAGYQKLQTLNDVCCGKVNILPFDYDGTLPSREKPRADTFETIFVRNSIPLSPQLLFEKEVPIFLQKLYRNDCLEQLNLDVKRIVLDAGLPKENRIFFAKRFASLINTLNEELPSSQSVIEYLSSVRKRFLDLCGISCSGVPESSRFELFAQKLRDDLDYGFPFWEMELPEAIAEKHKSNRETYLFYGISSDKSLVPVRFNDNPARFEFELKNGERISIRAEEAPDALVQHILSPTVTLLNYIVLSPARRPKSSDRKTRIHIGGNFMAGPTGYAQDLVPFFNRIPGKDLVTLVCTEYNNGVGVSTSKRKYISFGVVFPHYGRKGLELALANSNPFNLNKGEAFKEDES